MTTLRQAAQTVVDRWDAPLWKDEPATAVYIAALRKALEAPEQEPDIKALQAEGKGPAPCARFCESREFETEIRWLKSECDEYRKAADKMAAGHKIERDALLAERDALMADALRYRWITKQIVDDNMEQLEKAFSVFDDHAGTITQYEFDAAIDAAIGVAA